MGKPFTIVGNGKQTRDFVHVKDVSNAFILAAFSKIKNEIFNIGTGKSVSIRYLLNLVFKTFNLNWKEFVVINKKLIRAKDISESRADISKIKFFLKWTPKFYVEDVIKKLILKEI